MNLNKFKFRAWFELFVYSVEEQDTTDIFYTNGTISENKSWEIQCSTRQDRGLSFDLDISFAGRDHAGPSLEIQIWKYWLILSINDNRHWNYDTDSWHTEESSKQENDEWQKHQLNHIKDQMKNFSKEEKEKIIAWASK